MMRKHRRTIDGVPPPTEAKPPPSPPPQPSVEKEEILVAVDELTTMSLEDLRELAEHAGIDLDGVVDESHARQRILAHDESFGNGG